MWVWSLICTLFTRILVTAHGIESERVVYSFLTGQREREGVAFEREGGL